MKSKFVYLLLALLFSLGLEAQTSVIGKTPQLKKDYAQGVSGHAATMLRQGKAYILVMAGGCNFPEIPAVEGGAKRYYQDIYTTRYQRGKTISEWKLVGKLPKPFAYAAYQKYDNKLIIAGGKSTSEDLRSVYALSLNKDGHIKIDNLPSLPEPRSGMASALVGSRLYLIGGAVSGKLSNTVISLDLENPANGWESEEDYPGSPKLKVTAGVINERIYLFSSFTNTESNDKVIETELSLQVYHTKGKVWRSSNQQILSGATFGGAVAYSDSKEQSITFVGGVNEERFLPALRREQSMRIAKEKNDSEAVEQYKIAGREYLSQEPEWYKFNSTLFFLHEKGGHDSIQGSESADPSEHLAKADAALVELSNGHWLLLGGETKPGIRTPDICY